MSRPRVERARADGGERLRRTPSEFWSYVLLTAIALPVAFALRGFDPTPTNVVIVAIQVGLLLVLRWVWSCVRR